METIENYDMGEIDLVLSYPTVEPSSINFKVFADEDHKYCILSGYSKWDGCLNFMAGNTQIYSHLCSGIPRLVEVLQKIEERRKAVIEYTLD